MERQWGGRAVERLFQPSFYHVQTKNQQPYFCKLLIIRAENGTRTRDLNLGKVALYQLSYFRKYRFHHFGNHYFLRFGTANIN